MNVVVIVRSLRREIFSEKSEGRTLPYFLSGVAYLDYFSHVLEKSEKDDARVASTLQFSPAQQWEALVEDCVEKIERRRRDAGSAETPTASPSESSRETLQTAAAIAWYSQADADLAKRYGYSGEDCIEVVLKVGEPQLRELEDMLIRAAMHPHLLPRVVLSMSFGTGMRMRPEGHNPFGPRWESILAGNEPCVFESFSVSFCAERDITGISE